MQRRFFFLLHGTFLTDTPERLIVQKYSTILLLLIINENVLESTGVTLAAYLSHMSQYIKKKQKNPIVFSYLPATLSPAGCGRCSWSAAPTARRHP